MNPHRDKKERELGEGSKSKQKHDFNLDFFLQDPQAYFATISENQLKSEKFINAIFGFCVKRQSLRLMLIALIMSHLKNSKSVYDSKSLALVRLDLKNMILVLICEGQINVGNETEQRLESALQLDRDNFFYSLLPVFWQQSFNNFVSDLVKYNEKIDEGLYTLAIRFYCSHSHYEEAKKLYRELIEAGVEPHSRTLIPFLQCYHSYEELKDYHEKSIVELSILNSPDQVRKQSTLGKPTVIFYESFFGRLFEITTNSDKFLNEFHKYMSCYQFITPVMAKLFMGIFKYRKDLIIQNDGLIYSNEKLDLPIYKLSQTNISYEKKRLAALKIRDCCDAKGNNQNAIQLFEKFMQQSCLTWDIVLDGGNVGFYSGTFNHDRILTVLKWAKSLNYKVLIILYCKRKTEGIGSIERFIAQNPGFSIYYTPPNHNDDHFWLYASLTRDSYILTNDEMRDHAYLLRQDHMNIIGDDFQIWRTSRQIFYDLVIFYDEYGKIHETCEINMPKKFSHIIQINSLMHMIHAPVYDITKNSPHYLEHQDMIEGWVTFELPN